MVAVVDDEDGLANTTSPGPLSFDHATTSGCVPGLPSSDTVPERPTDVVGNVIDASSPALAVGATLAGRFTTTVMASEAVALPSEARSSST